MIGGKTSDVVIDMKGSFFFFKQKTAYEVRISDWSSDVCSSDLRGDGADEVADMPGNERRCCARSGVHAQAQHIDIGVEQPEHEIGRASCRERVCQYV